MAYTGSTLSGVVDRLERTRARIRLLRLLDALLLAVGSGLAVFLVLELCRRLFPAVWQGLPIPDLGGAFSSTAVGAAVALAVLLADAVTGIIGLPRVDTIARRADAHYGLKETISTALEVGRRVAGGKRPAVVDALLAEAADRERVIEPTALAAFRLSPAASAAAVLAVAALLVVLLVPTQPPPAVPEPLSGGPLADTERAEIAEDIRRVADLVEQEAERRSDSYMRAVANTLRDLGERVATTPSATRMEIMDELGVLSEHAAAASSEWRGSAGERIPQLLDALTQAIAQPAPVPAGQDAAAPSKGESAVGNPEATPDETDAGEASGDSLDSMLAEFEGRNEAGEAADAGAQPEMATDYISAAKAQNAARRAANANINDLENAQLLGPASSARAGDSRLAGEGTDQIGATPVEPAQVDFETAATLLLEGSDAGEGRQVELEVTPNTNFTEITEEGIAASAERWQRKEEATLARNAIAARNRDAVSRYLRALAGQTSE